MQMEFGPRALATFSRLDYSAWHAIAELVDNSTQSYFNNREVIDSLHEEAGETLQVNITYSASDDVFRIYDNAFGMDLDDLQHAMTIALPPKNSTGRSKYGMGLKTSAAWIGNNWEIKTKKYGLPVEYTVLVDVNRIAGGEGVELETTEAPAEEEDHYTIIEITNLNRTWHAPTIGRIKKYLGSMYRRDLASGSIVIEYNQDPLVFDDFENDLDSLDGQRKIKVPIEFSIGETTVKGWAGCLKHGAGGREKAGFSILVSGRMIQGFPDSYRPMTVFGAQEGGPNNVVNQRVVGEVELTGFLVTHTKDGIIWRGDEQDRFDAELGATCEDLVKFAHERRGESATTRGPTEVAKKAAVDELTSDLQSAEMVETLDFEVMEPPEAVARRFQDVMDVLENCTPYAEIDIPSFEGATPHVLLYFQPMAVSEPYVAFKAFQDDIRIVINENHPLMAQSVGADSFNLHLKHCAFDALAEYFAEIRGQPDKDTVRYLKDKLFRLRSEIIARQS